MASGADDAAALEAHARTFLAIAVKHPEFISGKLDHCDNQAARLEIELNVEMPLDMKDDGISPSGVRRTEPIKVFLFQGYPWIAPVVLLRDDFPRTLPHLLPGPATASPRPCLVEGSQREFFFQFGLIESGIFKLLEQAAEWLRRAAVSKLNDPAQGWEPLLRREVDNILSIDAEAARSLVTRKGGLRVFAAEFIRTGADSATLGAGVVASLTSTTRQVPLRRTVDDRTFVSTPYKADFSHGNTVVALIWAEKNPDGSAFVQGAYLPETIESLDDLHRRAADLHCTQRLRSFLSLLERCFEGLHLNAPIPVGIIFGVRRPFQLIGEQSDIELLPYVVEIRPTKGRTGLFAAGSNEPVRPAAPLDPISRNLLRRIADAPERPPIAMLGCGSVGSKLAMHAVRAGQAVLALSDSGTLLSHNLARHALSPKDVGSKKAEALGRELETYGSAPSIYTGDLVAGLRDANARLTIIPPAAKAAINATASLAVRDALESATRAQLRARLFEVGLFGRGRAAYMLADGDGHNPGHGDLMAELYATHLDDRLRELMFDPREGLLEVQIGQGCGSLTMAMDDARLSAMTAVLFEEISRATDQPQSGGQISVAITSDDGSAMIWMRHSVPSFEIVDIAGVKGWALRLSSRVAARIRSEASLHRSVETGGVLIGALNPRLHTVTVVDVVDAPSDSERSAGRFVLGTTGLKKAIEYRLKESGNTLFDVGTWHSHLCDSGPSATDWRTATELANGRPPPSVLLIATPRRFYALIAPRSDSQAALAT